MIGKRRVDWTNVGADASVWMMMRRDHPAAGDGRSARVL
jgi:hypothetical protein